MACSRAVAGELGLNRFCWVLQWGRIGAIGLQLHRLLQNHLADVASVDMDALSCHPFTWDTGASRRDRP